MGSHRSWRALLLRQMAQRLGVNEFECEGRCGFRGAFGAVVQHERKCPAAAATRAGGGSTISPAAVTSRPAQYTCQFRCGAQGTYDHMVTHEKGCNARPDASAVSGKDLATSPSLQTQKERRNDYFLGTLDGRMFKVYVCEWRCGYKGQLQQVLDHEITCAKNPAAELAPKASALDPSEVPHAFPAPPSVKAPHAAGLTASLGEGKAAELDSVDVSEVDGGGVGRLETRPGATSIPGESAATGGVQAQAQEGARYGCEYMCGFTGSFDEVAQHEVTCGVGRTAGPSEGVPDGGGEGRTCMHAPGEKDEAEGDTGSYIGIHTWIRQCPGDHVRAPTHTPTARPPTHAPHRCMQAGTNARVHARTPTHTHTHRRHGACHKCQ